MKKVASVRYVYDTLVDQLGILNCSIRYVCGVDGLKKAILSPESLVGKGIYEVEKEMLSTNDSLVVQYNNRGFSGVRCVIVRNDNE